MRMNPLLGAVIAMSALPAAAPLMSVDPYASRRRRYDTLDYPQHRMSEIVHIDTPKPLGKRAKRRAAGKLKAARRLYNARFGIHN